MLIVLNLQLIPTLPVKAQPIIENLTLPVILIHCYASDSSMWDEWEQYLNEDNISYKLVTFNINDSCGSSKQHAQELS